MLPLFKPKKFKCQWLRIQELKIQIYLREADQRIGLRDNRYKNHQLFVFPRDVLLMISLKMNNRYSRDVWIWLAKYKI